MLGIIPGALRRTIRRFGPNNQIMNPAEQFLLGRISEQNQRDGPFGTRPHIQACEFCASFQIPSEMIQQAAISP